MKRTVVPSCVREIGNGSRKRKQTCNQVFQKASIRRSGRTGAIKIRGDTGRYVNLVFRYPVVLVAGCLFLPGSSPDPLLWE